MSSELELHYLASFTWKAGIRQKEQNLSSQKGEESPISYCLSPLEVPVSKALGAGSCREFSVEVMCICGHLCPFFGCGSEQTGKWKHRSACQFAVSSPGIRHCKHHYSLEAGKHPCTSLWAFSGPYNLTIRFLSSELYFSLFLHETQLFRIEQEREDLLGASGSLGSCSDLGRTPTQNCYWSL